MMSRAKTHKKAKSKSNWSPKTDSEGDVKGLVLYLKKQSRVVGFLGKHYKTMFCTIPNSNPRRIEIYDNKARSGEPKRRIVFDALVDFRDPSKVDTKQNDCVDLVVEL